MDKSTCESIVLSSDNKRCEERKKYVQNKKEMMNILAQIFIGLWTLLIKF